VADITVSVSSPGIVPFGFSTFGGNTWGGDALSATFSIGEVQFVFANGWGSNLWGQFTYGIVGDVAEVTGSQINVTVGNEVALTDVNVSITGSIINLTIGDETTTADANTTVTGLGLNTVVGTSVGEPGNFSNVTGSQINLDEGSVTTDFQPNAGWGIVGWGLVPWGEEDDVIVPVTGTRINTIVFAVDVNADGNESVNIQDERLFFFTPTGSTTVADANLNVTGSRINITEGLAGVVVSANANVNVTGSQINITPGQAVGGIIQEVDVTGSQINVLIGNESTSANANVNVTGSRINLTPGDVDINFVFDVTGSRINTLINAVTVTGDAFVELTGIRLNVTARSVNITAWAEVQTGANNIWTPVDLAA